MTKKQAAKTAPKKTAKKKTTAKKLGRPVVIGANVFKSQRVPPGLVERVESRMRKVGCNWSDAVRQGLELWVNQ